MNTLIYCNDLEAFKTKLQADGYYDEESDTYPLKHTRTPVKKKEINGTIHSLSYVMDCVLNIDDYAMLTDLGNYEEMFADTARHDLYKSVYPYDVPVTYIDENDEEQSYTLPTKIGVFA